MRKVLVCGGRDYANRGMLFGVLDGSHTVTPIDLLIHGAALGADTLAQEWAEYRGVRSLQFPADWETHGKAAGPMRNKKMLLEKPELVIAFPGGCGTANMIGLAEDADIPVKHIHQ